MSAGGLDDTVPPAGVFAVIPAHGKAPIVARYNLMKHKPGPATVEKWAERDPDADIVYLPGLSHAWRGGPGLVVLDGDDAEALDAIRGIWGETPGKVLTRRGGHRLFRAPEGVDFGNVVSLRSYGLNIDFKHGNSIAVAPPSRHEDDRDFAYRWDGCDASVIHDLPAFDHRKLFEMMNRASGRRPLREGSRGLALNDHLCRVGGACDSFEDLLDCARTLVAGLVEAGHDPLPEAEIVKRAAAVWNDLESGKVERWHGRNSPAGRTQDEIGRLLAANPKQAGDAYLLLEFLRTQHMARCARGEAFAITPTAMARAQVLPGWTKERIVAARDLLLGVGLVVLIRPFTNIRGERAPARYRFAGVKTNIEPLRPR